MIVLDFNIDPSQDLILLLTLAPRNSPYVQVLDHHITLTHFDSPQSFVPNSVTQNIGKRTTPQRRIFIPSFCPH